jgi:hypothetical protein
VGNTAEVEAVGFSPGISAIRKFGAVERVARILEALTGVADGEVRFGEGQAEVDGAFSEAASVCQEDAGFAFFDGLRVIAEVALSSQAAWKQRSWNSTCPERLANARASSKFNAACARSFWTRSLVKRTFERQTSALKLSIENQPPTFAAGCGRGPQPLRLQRRSFTLTDDSLISQTGG